MRVKWLRSALATLNEEAEFVSKDNPAAATRTFTAIVDAVHLLQQYPAMGRPGRVPGTRELVIPDTPYIIPYRVRGEVLELLRVFHGARKWPARF